MSLWTLKSPLNAVVKKTVERLDHVGAFWKENSRQAHPLKTLINYAKQSNLSAETLNQENQTATVIHNSWRTELRNLSRRKRPPDEDDKSNKWRCLRTENERIKKKKSFYCNGTCIVDTKHPDWNKFGEFRTKDTAAIYKETLKICKIRKYNLAKRIELRLLLTNDLVAAEARHYITCRKNCQNPFSVNTPDSRTW